MKSPRLKSATGPLLGAGLASTVVLPPVIWLLTAALGGVATGGLRVLDEVSLPLLGRSLLIAALATGIAGLLGVPYGWSTARRQATGSGVLEVASLLPLLLPPYISSLAWSLFLMREGWFNTTLLGLGWIHTPIEWFRQFWLVVCVLGFAYWPILAWATAAAVRSVPRALEDAARLNATDARAARWSAGPALRGTLPAAALLVFLLCLAEFGAPNYLGIPTYPVEIVNRFQLDRNTGAVARMSLPLLLVVMPLVALQTRWLAGLPLSPPGFEATRSGGTGGFGAAVWCWVVLAVTALLPLGTLVAYSMPIETYAAVWGESQTHFVNTFVSAGGGALLALIVALTHGWLSRGRESRVLDVLLTLPYALPASLIGVAMIRILNRPVLEELYTSVGGLIWMYAALFYPFAYKILQPAWRQVDRELVEEGAVLGAGSWTRFRTTAWPVVRQYAWIAGALVALLAAREMDATALLRIPGGDTLAFRIQDYLHFAPTPNVAALCVIIVVIGAALAGITRWLIRPLN